MIVAEPAATPVTSPVTPFTVAAAVLLLLQVPLPVPLLLNIAPEPTHNAVAPLTVPADGSAVTFIVADVLDVPQPEETVYVIIVLPAATPVTTPVAACTVAAAVLLLLQLPPVLPLLDRVVKEPIHTDDAPLTVPAFSTGLTVIGYVAAEVPQEVVTV